MDIGVVVLTLLYVVGVILAFAMNLMSWGFFLQFNIAFFFVIWMAKTTHVLGAKTGSKIAKANNRKYIDESKKEKRMMKFLAACESVVGKIGLEPSKSELYEWSYLIRRCLPDLPYVNRKIKAIELLGLIRATVFIVFVSCAYAYIMTFQAVFVPIAVVIFFLPAIAKTILTGVVNAQDQELEHDFPELFLLLYCSLVGGVNSYIAPALLDYTRTMDALYNADQHKAIRKFVLDLRNEIEVHGSEPEALTHMRDNYRSALILNFCNLAVQSLNGVDTKDKLLAFKMELSAKQQEEMKREAAARVEAGRKSIFLIYAILFEFVVISWASKIF